MEDKVEEAEGRLEDANAVIDSRNDTIDAAANGIRTVASRRVCEVRDSRYEPRFAILVRQQDDDLTLVHFRLVRGTVKTIQAKIARFSSDHELLMPPVFVPNPILLIQRSIERCEEQIKLYIKLWNCAVDEWVRLARAVYTTASRDFGRRDNAPSVLDMLEQSSSMASPGESDRDRMVMTERRRSGHVPIEFVVRRIACRQELSRAKRERKLKRSDVLIKLNRKTIELRDNRVVDYDVVYSCFIKTMCDAKGGSMTTHDDNLRRMTNKLKKEFARTLNRSISELLDVYS
jgi:hypothetical protein